MTRVNEFLATRYIANEFIGFLAQRGALGLYYDNCANLEDTSRDEVKRDIFCHARARYHCGQIHKRCMTNILTHSFLWRQTGQGFEFWKSYHHGFNDIVHDKSKVTTYELLGIEIV